MERFDKKISALLIAGAFAAAATASAQTVEPPQAGEPAPIKLINDSDAIENLYKRCVHPERPKSELFKGIKELPDFVTLEKIADNSISLAYNLAFPGRPVIFYAHGQGETIKDLARFFSLFQGRNMNMISWDAPCYGDAPGTDPTEKSVSAAALKVLHWVHAKAPEMPIILWGQSFGAAVEFQVFQLNLDGPKIPIRGMVAISPWTNYQQACRDVVWAFTSHICKDEKIGPNLFDNITPAKKVNVPILFMWSEGDNKVPKKRSVEVMQNVPDGFAKVIELDRGVAHEHLADNENLERIADWIEGSLIALLAPKPAPKKTAAKRLPAKAAN